MSEQTITDGERHRTQELDGGYGTTNRSLRWGAGLIVIAGIGFLTNGFAMLYRAFVSGGFEPGVGPLGGVTGAELAATNHELYHYVQHLHVNVAALLVAVGIGVIVLAWFGIRRGRRWALGTTVAMTGVFVALSMGVHGSVPFSFDTLVHLGPGLVWLPALVVGVVLSSLGLRRHSEN